MSDDELTEDGLDEEPELDEDDLVEDVEDDVDDELDIVLDDELDIDLEVEVEVEEPRGLVVATDEGDDEEVTDEDEDVLELEEEQHPDDIEAPLDALLQERTASATLEDDEEELDDEEADLDDRGDGATRIVPRRPGEFLCSSCFLVLPRHQLADEAKMLCKDCA
jgi:hypothetical protein